MPVSLVRCKRSWRLLGRLHVLWWSGSVGVSCRSHTDAKGRMVVYRSLRLGRLEIQWWCF